MKPIICINKETGEVIKDWEIQWLSPVSERFYLYANVKGKTIQKENIGCYQKNEKPNLMTHPIFGDYLPLESQTRFTKVYRIPEFSSFQYSHFWLIIQRSIERNTGAICYRQPNGKLKRVSSMKEWQQLLQAKQTMCYQFVKEAMEQHYIAKFTTSIHCWIVNPKYVWNGTLQPKTIAKLFQ